MPGLVRACGALSLAAAALHAALVEEHFREWWGFGLFFVLAALAQALYGLILVALPAKPSTQAWDADSWRAWTRRLFLAGIVGNLAVIVLYAVSRTVGVPLGPDAGAAEAIDPLGLVTKGAELLTVIGLVALHRQTASPDAPTQVTA